MYNIETVRQEDLVTPSQARNNRGSATWIESSPNTTLKEKIFDKKFRTIWTSISVNKTTVLLVINVYAPNDHKKSNEYFGKICHKTKKIQTQLRSTTVEVIPICGGNFNASINQTID